MLDSFRNVRSEMIWRGAALEQIDAFEAMASRLGVELEAIGKHTSKSIALPVVKLSINGSDFVMRDNFYDVNLLVKAREPVRLTLPEFFTGIYEPLDWAWYLNEIARARGYSWSQYTDEEMDDPRILRARITYDQVKSPEEKDRWIKRMSDPAWWSNDWSGGELTWDGSFEPGVAIFSQRHPYAEGIQCDGVPTKYVQGLNSFIVALPRIEDAETVIRRVADKRLETDE